MDAPSYEHFFLFTDHRGYVLLDCYGNVRASRISLSRLAHDTHFLSVSSNWSRSLDFATCGNFIYNLLIKLNIMSYHCKYNAILYFASNTKEDL